MTIQTKLYGARLSALLADARSAAGITVTRGVTQPIQGDRWARNGMHPNAQLVNMLDESVNQSVLFRSKEYFSWYGTIIPVFPAGTADEVRWRFAFRSGPYAHAVLAVVAMLPPGGAISTDVSTTCRLDIMNAAGTIVATETFVYGPNPKFGGIVPDAWPHYKPLVKVIDGISPDTDYFGVFTTQGGRLQSACVAELSSLTEAGGYLPQNLTAQSSVLDVYRKYQIKANNKLWQRGGAKLFNWVSDNGSSSAPLVRASSTDINVIDGTSTAVSASTPGYTFDLRGKAREGLTGVPVTIKAYGSCAFASGLVKLKNSAGVTVATVTLNATVDGWFSTTATLPATVDKYDLHYAGSGVGNLTLYAVTGYELG
jgi:hypothetical protein